MAYATWSPSQKTTDMSVTGSDLVAQVITGAQYNHVRGSDGKTSGKLYWEITLGSGSASVEALGVVNESFPVTDGLTYAGKTTNCLVQYRNGNIVKNDVPVGTGSGWGTAGDVLCFALDIGGNKMEWKRNNGAWATVTSQLPSGTLYPYFGTAGGGATASMTVNFGATAFVYTPPVGYSGWQVNTNYEHSMLAEVSIDADTDIHLNPLYINMLAEASFDGDATVVFTNATRYEHSMLAEVSIDADTALSFPRNELSAARPAHTIAASVADSAAIAEVLPAYVIDAGFSSPDAISGDLPPLAIVADGVFGAIGACDEFVAAHTLDGNSSWHSENVLAAHSIVADGVCGGVAELLEPIPPLALMADAIADGEMSGAMVLPIHSVSVDYWAGAGGSANLLCAAAVLVADGYSGAVSSAGLDLPAYTAAASGHGPYTAIASLVLAPHTLEASASSAIATAFRAWALNLRKTALTEYSPFQFNSFATFDGKVYGASAAGIMELGAQQTDAGSSIAATVRTGQHAFGTSYLKRVPRIYVGYKATGDMEFRTITGEDGTRAYLLDHNGNLNLHQRRVPVGLGPKSPYWQFEFANRDGADFTIDHVLAHSAKVTRRRVM